MVACSGGTHSRHTPHMAKDRADRAFLRILWRRSQQLSKHIYPFVTRRVGGDTFLLQNYGYEEDAPMALPLEASDEPNRFCIQLYHRTATQADLSGKRVLEVGSGHGGGASYLMRTLHPASYTGLDLNPAAVAFCRKRHNLAGLEFVHGDAENLPFPDQSFDAVINIESSFHYPRFPCFLAGVARVLRPGGYFLYADFRPVYVIAAWEAALANAPIRMLSQSEINAEVMRGMEKILPPSLDSYDRHVPTFLRGVIRKVVSANKAGLYRTLQSGKASYRLYCFAKA
jgi:ubiquinone/menaquinone biosynthesis C-methylase UbiE